MEERKQPTRAHFIHDLGLNCIELPILRAGFVMERIRSDYGYDAQILTFDENGRIEAGSILVQLNSSDFLKNKGNRALPSICPKQT